MDSISCWSPGRPWPSAIRSRTSTRCVIPSRQGKHLPQDSNWQKATRLRTKIDGAHVLAADDDAAGAEDGPGLGHLLEVEDDVHALRA